MRKGSPLKKRIYLANGCDEGQVAKLPRHVGDAMKSWIKKLKPRILGTLKGQFVIAAIVIVAMIMGVFVWDQGRRQQLAAQDQLANQADAVVSAMAGLAATGLATRDFASMQNMVDDLSKVPDFQRAMVLGTDGKVLAHTDRAMRGQYLSDLPKELKYTVLLQSDDAVEVARPVMPAGQAVGWVRVQLSAEALNTRIKQATIASIPFAVAAAVLAGVLSGLLAHRLTRRLTLVLRVVELIQRGNSSRRAEIKGADEAAQLAWQFNSLLDKLEQREGQLAASKDALQVSKARLATFMDVTGEGVWDWDMRNNLVDHNATWYRTMGMPVQTRKLTAAEYIALLHPEDRDLVFGRVTASLAANQAFRSEHRLIRADGQVIWVEDRGTVVERDAQGKPQRMVGSISDITQRKQASEEARIAAIAFEAREAIYVCDANWKILKVNKAFSQVTGYSAAESVGRRPIELHHSGRNDPHFFAALNATVLGAGVWQGEIWNRRRDGELFASWVSIAAVHDERGNIAYFVSTMTDAAARKSEPQGNADTGRGADLPPATASAVVQQTGRGLEQRAPPDVETPVGASLEADLREAVYKQQFVLHFQPQVTSRNQVIGAEVLVRWLHPQRGLIAPAEFVGVAEATGLIVQLGTWVLETACRQLVAWASQPDLADLVLAVNISAKQIQAPNFVAVVLNALHATGANPRRLKLELTESLLVSNVDDVIDKMNRLKAHGISFSLDDFGTGFSSLSYLKRLPLDQLKIDQSFVRDVLIDANDAAIANMVIALGTSLSLSVIAEGVETQEQCAFLASQGCTAYQGYLFSRPLPLAGFENFMARWGHEAGMKRPLSPP